MARRGGVDDVPIRLETTISDETSCDCSKEELARKSFKVACFVRRLWKRTSYPTLYTEPPRHSGAAWNADEKVSHSVHNHFTRLLPFPAISVFALINTLMANSHCRSVRQQAKVNIALKITSRWVGHNNDDGGGIWYGVWTVGPAFSPSATAITLD